MRIGIVGAGHIGGTLAEELTEVGHDVAIANSRAPQTLRGLVARLGDRGHAATAAEAEGFGEAVVVSVPFGRYDDVPADGVAGKVIIDTCNYYPQRDGHYEELDSGRTTSSELVQRHFPGAKVVKAFNAIRWTDLRERRRPPGAADRMAIPISGDDPDAKRIVAELIDEIGFDAVDVGDLSHGGRKHQPGTPAYGAVLTADDLRAELG